MSTFLGATAELDHTALHERDIAKSKIYYMEGYLAASPTGLQVIYQQFSPLARTVCLTHETMGSIKARFGQQVAG